MKKFDPQIYPRTLFILDDIEELKFFESRNEGEELSEGNDNAASIWIVVEKETQDYCVVAYFKKMRFDLIAHESVHIANSIFNDCGVDFDYAHDEHFAYMAGWVAKCIAEALGLTIVKEEKK